MNRHFFLVMALLLVGGRAKWAAADSSKAESEGQVLAQQLLAQKPAEDSTITGVLKMRDGRGKRTELPVRCRIIVTTTNWQSVYETMPATNAPDTVRLTVIHSDSGPNEYRLSERIARKHRSAARVLTPGAQPLPGEARDRDNPGIECTILRGDQAMIPFAGSDFWMADLGLEFLHWPEQRLLKKEMRRGQSCNMLESLNPQSGADGYARVVSWLDIDTGGIVHAEAYDAKHKLLKGFDPKEFKKVNGRWELREMEIRSVKEKSSTRLEFNLERK
jgi:hypothetical protein